MFINRHVVWIVCVGLTGCSFPNGALYEPDPNAVLNNYTWIHVDQLNTAGAVDDRCRDLLRPTVPPLPEKPVIPQDKLHDRDYIQRRLITHISELRSYIRALSHEQEGLLKKIRRECLRPAPLNVKRDGAGLSNSQATKH